MTTNCPECGAAYRTDTDQPPRHCPVCGHPTTPLTQPSAMGRRIGQSIADTINAENTPLPWTPGPSGGNYPHLERGTELHAAAERYVDARLAPEPNAQAVDVPVSDYPAQLWDNAQPEPSALSPDLADMVDRWCVAKDVADDATSVADELGRAIKDTCAALGFVGTLTDSRGNPAARVEESTAWRLNTNALKSEHPEVYAAYARQSTSRRLVAVK